MPAPIDSATMALSTTAAAMPNHPCRWVIINNDDASIAMKLGDSGSQDLTIPAGANTGPLPVRNTNQIYLKSASGTPTISYLWGN